MTTQPSLGHGNRRAHNWSIFDAGDRALARHRQRLTGTLVDLGCGERPYEAFLSGACERYVGVDWSATPHTLRADVLADLNLPLPFADGSVDSVVSLSVMEHLAEPQAFLAEAARVLRPGGTMLVQVPFQWRVHEAPHDYFRFTRFGLERLFARAGFADVAVEATTGFWVMWTVKLNYQLKRLVRGPAPVRAVVGAVLAAVFWIDQHLAILADKAWPDDGTESAGYFVVARKPGG
jgi:SAM-dependent methyltransferase